nr:hypothetical protein [Tanacetum cinerariifolium]
MYVSGHVAIFDMVDIDLFTVVALNMMVLKLGYTGKSELMFYNYLRPLTSLNEGLYGLTCKEDVRCLATLVRSFKSIEVYIEHGITTLDFYLRALRFRATIEEITDEPSSIAAYRTKKMLLLTWHESSETTKEPIRDSITPSSLPQHDSSTLVRIMFVTPLHLEVSTQEPIVAEVSTQEPIVAEVSTHIPIVEEVETQEISLEDVVLEDYEIEYDVQSSKDAGTDDDDVDEDFLVDEENKIKEPDVDVYFLAVEKRLRGNVATKKTQMNFLKQQYENFNASSLEVLDQTFDRIQKLISQLEIHGESTSHEDVNQKFLRSSKPTVKKPVDEISEAKASADKLELVRKNFGSSIIKN